MDRSYLDDGSAPTAIRAKKLYDVEELLGAENAQYLKIRGNFRNTDDRGDGKWLVSKTSFYRLRSLLNKFRQEDEIRSKKQLAHVHKPSARKRRKLRGPSSAILAAAHDFSDDSSDDSIETTYVDTNQVEFDAAEFIVVDEVVEEDDKSSDFNSTAAGRIDGSQSFVIAETAEIVDDILDPEYSSSNDDADMAVSGSKKKQQLKNAVLQFLQDRIEAERAADDDSDDVMLSDSNGDDEYQRKSNRLLTAQKDATRPVLTVEFEADQSIPAAVIGDNSSSDEDELQELPIVPAYEQIGNNQFSGNALFANDISGVDNSSAISTELYSSEKRKGVQVKKSMQTLLKLQTAARIEFLRRQPQGGLNWTNLTKHLGSLLDMTQVDMTTTLQLLKASNLDPKLSQLPETGKSLMEPKRGMMKMARVEYKPIPIGTTGDYGHYGLIEGLLGMSIGTMCKNNRFLLDKLVEKRKKFFGNSILNLNNTSNSNDLLLLSEKMDRMKKRMLRFRQKKIEKFEALNPNDDTTGVEGPSVPPDAILEEEMEIYDPMDEENYMNSEARRKERRRIRRGSESSCISSDEDRPEAGDEEYDAETSDYCTSGTEWNAPRSLRPAVRKRKPKAPTAAATLAKQQLDAKRRKAAVQVAADADARSVPFFPADDPNYVPFLGEENVDWGADDGAAGQLGVPQLLDSDVSDPCTESEPEQELDSCFTGPSPAGSLGEHCSECKGRRIPHLEFEISADGVTMQKKAVKDCFWPLMGQLISVSPCIHVKDTHKYYLPRNSKPIVIGFYHGSTKPSCANEYLACVFKEMQLAEKHRLCTSYLKFFIGDGPARQFIKGFPSHAAYCGCERCSAHGFRVKLGVSRQDPNRNVYGHVCVVKTRKLHLRTLENYLEPQLYREAFPNPDNILYKYSLCNPVEFDIIHSVPLDSMHTVFHVAIGWLFHHTWFKGDSVKGHKFSKPLMDSLEKKLARVKGCLPYTIKSAVGSKPLSKFGKIWSCSEKRIFLLYISIVIMVDPLMKPDDYKVLLALHHAIMLLVGSGHMSVVSDEDLRKAELNLIYFLEKCENLYSLEFPRYTVHCLLHIVNDLRKNKCRLDYCSMFKYESAMKFFTKICPRHGGHRTQAILRNALMRKSESSIVLPPVCQKRRATLEHGQTGRDTIVQHLSTYNVDEFGIMNRISRKNPDFYQLGEEGNPRDAYELHITKSMQRLIFRDFIISTKYPNNVVLVKNKGVCVVSKICYKEEHDAFFVTLAPFVKQGDFFKRHPCNSSVYDIYLVTGGISSRVQEINSKMISNQYVCLMFDRQTQSDDPKCLDKEKTSWVCIPLMHSSLN